MARRLSLAAALVLAVVALLAPAEAKGSKGVRRNSALHGKPRKKGRRPPPRKKKRREYDYDDDDDDDDDFGGGSRQMTYYKPRRKPTGPSVLQRAQAMAKEASARGLEMSKVAASRAKDLAAEAAVKGQEASRLAKAYYSSEYEKFLLTATWPSDQRVSPQLAKRLVESVARFPARPHALPDDDPYRVTLRKLWKKMIERDWRTTQKALYLLHALSRSTPTKNARALSRTLKSMVGDADPKTGRKYFSRRELVALRGFRDRLAAHGSVRDTVTYLADAVGTGAVVLAEGANAAMLDPDFRTYPYVTSSTTTIGGVCNGLGLPPRKIDCVLGVVKAYTTRVGAGPLAGQDEGEMGNGSWVLAFLESFVISESPVLNSEFPLISWDESSSLVEVSKSGPFP